MTASTRSQTDNFKVMRSILTELVPKAQVGEVSRLMALAVHAGYNDFYLREADENVIQSMFGCDELFTRGVMAKILSKLRANELPPPAEPASPEDYQVAINHFRDQESRNGGKILHGAQSDYINDLFFTKNINMQHAVLSRKLRGQQTGNHKGRAQLLSDEICREVITPALKLFRSKGQTKWTPMVKLLMRQLLRIQEGVEAPTGILELIQRNHAHFANISDIIDSDDDSNDSDSSSDTTEGDGDEGRGEQEILNEEEQEELMTVDLQTGQLLDHIAASKSSGKRLQFHDFPNNRTFKRYKKKYKWAERKLEVLAAHRQSGSNGPAIQKNYAELQEQYKEHDIRHPDQIIVTDEIHWQKSWENALALISCMVSDSDKRSQSGGPGKVSDGVTATPVSSIIGKLYCVQVILKDSQKTSPMQRSLILWCNLAFQKHALWCTEQGLDIRQLSHSKICSRFLL